MQKIFLLLLMFLLNSAKAQNVKEAEDLMNSYQFEKALTVLKILDDTSDIHVPLQKGYCYFRLGSYRLSVEYYLKALQLDSLNRMALIQLGQLYSRNNDIDQAKRCYEKLIALDSNNNYYFKQYASFASATNDLGLAKNLYSKALAINPDDMESCASLGAILLEFEDFHSLDSLLNEALMRDGLQTSLWLLKAKSLMGQKLYRDALATMGKVLEKHDTIPTYARLLGICYFKIDEYEKVVRCMNFLLDSNLKSDWVYYYLGVSYRELGDLQKSIECLSQAIEEGESENIGSYYSQLARTFEENKDYKNAIHYYKAAYEKSKSKILLYQLARNYDIYYADKSTAITYYRLYFESDDTIKVAKEFSNHRLNQLIRY